MKVYAMGSVKGSLRRKQIYHFKHKVNKQVVAKIDDPRSRAIEAILKDRPKPFKGKIDYKALINAGRKY